MGAPRRFTLSVAALGYTTARGFTTLVNSESTYDLIAHQWTVPVNLLFSQVFKVGDQTIQFPGRSQVLRRNPCKWSAMGCAIQSDRFISRTLIERRNQEGCV
jgi:hypothetical protein